MTDETAKEALNDDTIQVGRQVGNTFKTQVPQNSQYFTRLDASRIWRALSCTVFSWDVSKRAQCGSFDNWSVEPIIQKLLDASDHAPVKHAETAKLWIILEESTILHTFGTEPPCTDPNEVTDPANTQTLNSVRERPCPSCSLLHLRACLAQFLECNRCLIKSALIKNK